MKTKTFYDLTTDQYTRLLSLPPEPRPQDLIGALECRHPDTLQIKTIQEWVGQDWSLITPPTDLIGLDLMSHEGELYGHAKMSEITYGEMTDLLTYLEDPVKHLPSIMAILWRRAKVNSWGYLKAKLAGTLYKRGLHILAYKIMRSIQYEVHPYDAVEADLQSKTYKAFPAWTAHKTLGFILLFFEVSQQDTLKSLVQEMMDQKKSKTQPQEL